MHERALRVGDPKLRAGLQVGSMMGRIWIVALAVILVARFAGGKDDGIMAAALLLAAFTVYFVISFFDPQPARGPPRAAAPRGARARHERDRDGGSPGHRAPVRHRRARWARPGRRSRAPRRA